ncbi:hypothetical protein EXIGLDRAFT_491136 [Exidia glandulosa HHB12029]|uniref:Uncharacterized protein n=1 Tax=Exidia glandulosa HHB12029 TaxID=1314781 RepID=A0A166NBQ9_EXIGL|nr:hypothetical protein EXIGLDRAFT_491136 [Exidia glandulosa HHB12029]
MKVRQLCPEPNQYKRLIVRSFRPSVQTETDTDFTSSVFALERRPRGAGSRAARLTPKGRASSSVQVDAHTYAPKGVHQTAWVGGLGREVNAKLTSAYVVARGLAIGSCASVAHERLHTHFGMQPFRRTARWTQAARVNGKGLTIVYEMLCHPVWQTSRSTRRA